MGWCASNFPQEITTAMGIPVVYPENMGAAVGAKGGGQRMCEHAEGMGYSADLCSYARINFAYTDLKECPELEIPFPDFLLCCSNICNCMIKWYENLALELDIPLILIDIPHLDGEACGPDRVKYIRAQFDDCIRQLEAITGKTMDHGRLREVMAISQRSSRAWLRAVGTMENVPSPFSGFDIFNNMAVACVGRGTAEAAEAFELLAEDDRGDGAGLEGADVRRREDRGDQDDAVHLPAVDPFVVEELGDHHAQLVAGILPGGGQTPVVHHFRPVKQGGFDVGVADVEGEKHFIPAPSMEKIL